MKILVTGSTGRLGSYLVPILKERGHTVIETGRRKHYDITYPIPHEDCDFVVHLAAYTDVVKAQTEIGRCFDINVKGTMNLVHTYREIPFVFISTEYAKRPLGIYALSKHLAEKIVLGHKQHLILRTSFKPNPWPFDVAYVDQYTQGDYIDIVAGLLADRIEAWKFQNYKSGKEYLGTGRKTIYELAKRTKPDVKPNSVDEYNKEIGMTLIPKDYL